MRRYIAMPGSTPLANEQVLVDTFPDGETAITVPDIGIDDDIVLIGGCPDAQASESFLAAAYEIAAYGPHSLTVVNTYFRHARQERKFGKQAVMAKFQARQWSGIGVIFPGVRLVFQDLHNDLVLSYFECATRASNISALPLLERKMQNLWGGLVKPVYATVDYGGVHEARALAESRSRSMRESVTCESDARGVGFAHIDKKRLSGTETEIREVHGDVEGCDVVIFDDVIATGGSIVKASNAYKERGARRIFVVASHAVIAKNGEYSVEMLTRLRRSPVEGILVTDSHPNASKAHEHAPDFMTVYQIRPEQLAPPA